jgi:hypothetical protein
MDNKITSDIIAEGIHDGITRVIVEIAWGIIGFGICLLIGLLGFTIWQHFYNPVDISNTATSMPSVCNYPYVNCKIYLEDRETEILVDKEFCGYQEASNYFNILKNNKKSLSSYKVNDINKLNLWCKV